MTKHRSEQGKVMRLKVLALCDALQKNTFTELAALLFPVKETLELPQNPRKIAKHPTGDKNDRDPHDEWERRFLEDYCRGSSTPRDDYFWQRVRIVIEDDAASREETPPQIVATPLRYLNKCNIVQFVNLLSNEQKNRVYDTPINELRLALQEAKLADRTAVPSPASSESSDVDAPAKLRMAAIDMALLTEYPSDYYEKFAGISELCITGLNLRRAVPALLGKMRSILQGGGRIKVLAVDPNSDAARYGAVQDYGPHADPTDYRATILMNLESIDALRTLGKRRDALQTRTIDYPLTFGLDCLDLDQPSGAIYVRFYPLFSQKDDQPFVKLQVGDHYWYGFYKEQFAIHWGMGREWQRASGRSQSKGRQ